MITELFIDIYNNFQQNIFDDSIAIPAVISKFVKDIYKFHKQKLPKISYNNNNIPSSYHNIAKNNTLLLAYSGGLDSIVQALYLRDVKHFDVTLYHIKGINKYENGQATKATELFAKKHKFKLIEVDNFKTTNKKYWPENPMKNQMIFAKMIDYCIENNIYNIASGDNFTLSAKDATIGVNYSDTKECQDNFLNIINKFTNIQFINLGKTKSQEVQFAIDNNVINEYYSCLSPGRFNQSWRKATINKFHLKSSIIPKYMCCKCRKCAENILLLKYLGKIDLPEDFEEYLWDKQLSGKYSARQFYWKNMTKENRIQLLLED